MSLHPLSYMPHCLCRSPAPHPPFPSKSPGSRASDAAGVLLGSAPTVSSVLPAPVFLVGTLRGTSIKLRGHVRAQYISLTGEAALDCSSFRGQWDFEGEGTNPNSQLLPALSVGWHGKGSARLPTLCPFSRCPRCQERPAAQRLERGATGGVRVLAGRNPSLRHSRCLCLRVASTLTRLAPPRQPTPCVSTRVWVLCRWHGASLV